MPTKPLNRPEQEKYSRQTVLQEIGVAGQEKLKRSKIIIIGVGALGTHTAELLARAGVGQITLVDADIVEASNIQRQALFTEQDIGQKKAVVAGKAIRKINSLITINVITQLVDEKNINTIKELQKATLIIDGTDNFTARFLVNDFCKKKKIPWIYASCVATSGYVMPVFPEGPCLRCFLKEGSVDSVCTSGILNTLPSVIGSLQATLAIKMIVGEKVEPFLTFYDGWKSRLERIKVIKKCGFCL